MLFEFGINRNNKMINWSLVEFIDLWVEINGNGWFFVLKSTIFYIGFSFLWTDVFLFFFYISFTVKTRNCRRLAYTISSKKFTCYSILTSHLIPNSINFSMNDFLSHWNHTSNVMQPQKLTSNTCYSYTINWIARYTSCEQIYMTILSHDRDQCRIGCWRSISILNVTGLCMFDSITGVNQCEPVFFVR